jgi:hypothetical protein
MAVVVQDLNKRAQAFNAECEESMGANQMKFESGTTQSDALSTARTVPRETDVMASHTYGSDIHHAPTCRTSPLRSSPQTNLDGNDSNARESSKQAVNSKYKVEKPKQLESNADLELWWSKTTLRGQMQRPTP